MPFSIRAVVGPSVRTDADGRRSRPPGRCVLIDARPGHHETLIVLVLNCAWSIQGQCRLPTDPRRRDPGSIDRRNGALALVLLACLRGVGPGPDPKSARTLAFYKGPRGGTFFVASTSKMCPKGERAAVVGRFNMSAGRCSGSIFQTGLAARSVLVRYGRARSRRFECCSSWGCSCCGRDRARP